MNNSNELHKFLVDKLKNEVTNALELHSFMASMLFMVELLCDLYLETSMLDQEGMQRFRELKDCLQNLKANRPTGIMH
jgi:hypothetical protein